MYSVQRPVAKMGRDPDGKLLATLPLLHHSAYVAAVLERLLSIPTIRKRLARLGGLDDLTPEQVWRLCVLGAIHDFAKVVVGFQRKGADDPAEAGPLRGHIQPAVAVLFGGENGGSYDEADRLYDAIAKILRLDTMETWFRDGMAGLEPALKAVLSHHGSLPKAGAVEPEQWAPDGGYDPMAALRELAGHVRGWYPGAFGPAADRLPNNARFLRGFAGLLVLADFLGSDQSRFALFPVGTPPPPEDPIHAGRSTADRIVVDRWLDPTVTRRALGGVSWQFGNLFPKLGNVPRPLQAFFLAMSLPGDGAPSVVIAEAETGSGKTEAALIYFLRMLLAGLVDGMYFALPTRASAIQIHRRITRDLRRILGAACPPVGLAVPGYIRADDQDGRRVERYKVAWDNDDGGVMPDRGWAVEEALRFLAGMVMVGTVDQLLLGAIRVKHSGLRAFAMLRNLVVVDEVHASDTYMETLLGHALDQHRAAGGHALLMSATLGSAARHRLTGRADAPPSPANAARLPYPGVTVGGLDPVEPTGGEAPPSKTVEVTVMGDPENLAEIAGQAVDAARTGARVLVIVNSVRRAQRLQRRIEAAAGDDADLVLRVAGRPCPHHARYAVEDRIALDEALEAAFSREATAPCIAVTTQTAEQSLDIDADLLITDLCPADVLLQRIGRLFRFDKDRPDGFTEPRVVVLAPTLDVLEGLIGRNGDAFPRLMGFGLVYPNVLALAGTLIELRKRAKLILPAENRVLVEAATHPDALAKLAGHLGGRWPLHAESMRSAQTRDLMEAWAAKIRWEDHVSAADRSNDRLGTRLGVGDVAAKLGGVVGPFGGAIHTIKVPWWMVPETETGPTAENVRRDGDAILFEIGGVDLTYDRLGLRRIAD